MPSNTASTRRLYAGVMSGTSLDGADAVLVDFEPPRGGRLAVLGHVHEPFPLALKAELLALNAPGGTNELHRAALAGNALAVHYAQLIGRLLREAGRTADEVVAAGVHGQTVRHRPGEFDGVGYTLQLGNPSLVAERACVDVVTDFRSRDVAAGGQGAPLVPAFHRAMFGQVRQATAVLNLGGIANLTLLRAGGETHGFDCGPANALMDGWIERCRGAAYDADGTWAATGSIDTLLLDTLLQEPYLAMPYPKSTGRDLFNMPWLEARLLAAKVDDRGVPAENVQATLLEFTARAAVDALLAAASDTSELLVCGGGARNGALMARLASLLAPAASVLATDARGLPAEQVEGAAFAWLAQAHVARQAGNLASVTGASGPRVLGALYPR